jgi:CMP-N,N'-diacetyllegionaminic acid synthase
MKIIIPARQGSKGFPFKNRKLLKYTLESIPDEKLPQVWVTTDDPIISTASRDHGVNVIRRPDEFGSDTSSIRDVLVHAVKEIGAKSDELIIMLYLTYPERTWEEVESAIDFFLTYYQTCLTDSMLCRKESKTNPYLCLQEYGVGGIFGKQIVQHDLYRRQDYPSCFEISHYISIFKAGALTKLNRNLYCDTTVFYPIDDVIDVDFEKNLLEFNGK